MTSPRATHDVIVVGAGVFGAWTALLLRRAGHRVLLLDAYGPGHARQSSGGETRIIRMGYGKDEVYSRMACRSLELWKALGSKTNECLFARTGVLWMARDKDALSTATLETLSRLLVPHEKLSRADLEVRWPQIAFGDLTWAIHEPESGVLFARRAVQAAVRQAVAEGVVFEIASVAPPTGGGRIASIALGNGATVSAGAFVLALGPWLGRAFPDVLGDRIFPTRQEVFYFGTPSGDRSFAMPAMPAWIDFAGEIYGVPDLEGKGFKVAPDRHGEPIDPDLAERTVTPETLASARAHLAARFPALAGAPLVGSEICQYENTSSGDFLIDRHPAFENVWLVGGGSGHGFKHGPAVGEAVVARIEERGVAEPRFDLATKAALQRRQVF